MPDSQSLARLPCPIHDDDSSRRRAENSATQWSRCSAHELTIISVIRRSLMGAQATGEVHRSHGGHYDVYQGVQSFDDVIQIELEFLHRHAKKAD